MKSPCPPCMGYQDRRTVSLTLHLLPEPQLALESHVCFTCRFQHLDSPVLIALHLNSTPMSEQDGERGKKELEVLE